MLQEMTKKAVQKLQKETGHVLAVADFELVADLDKIAKRITGNTEEERRLLTSPFELCGIAFYPLTVAKTIWYAEKCEEWCLEGVFQDAFLFWILSLPNNEAVFETYALRKDANKAVRKLSRRLHCSQEDITGIFQKCTGNVQGGGEKESDFGGLIACLLREYGGTPEQWLYNTPIETISAMVAEISKRICAEHDSVSKSSDKASAPKATGKLEALRDFRIKSNEIKARWETNG